LDRAGDEIEIGIRVEPRRSRGEIRRIEDVVAVQTDEILAGRQPRAEVPRRRRAASLTKYDPRAAALQTSDDLARVHIDRRIVDDDDFGGRTRLLLDAVDGFEEHLPQIA